MPPPRSPPKAPSAHAGGAFWDVQGGGSATGKERGIRDEKQPPRKRARRCNSKEMALWVSAGKRQSAEQRLDTQAR
eukprot:6004347-Alexandrium_andersonii.AAC.1